MNGQQIHNELQSIRQLMERSAKFLSLSGLSGVLMGIFAILGAWLGYTLLEGALQPAQKELWLIALGALVLLLSVGACILLTSIKARKVNQSAWNPASRALLYAMAFPLITGGLILLICITRGYYDLIIPTSLIFYGLALVTGGQFTFSDVRILGVLEIILGLGAFAFPSVEIGLILWATGFGLLHIIYGIVMYLKYDRGRAR